MTRCLRPDAPQDRMRRIAVALAVLSAGALAALLGVRTLTSPDLGYHLAYGDRFWAAGEIVDHNPFLYTLPDVPAGERPAAGPGCWYDRDGRYRFPNANWLSQVVMSGVHRLGGPEALTILQAALVAGVFALSLAGMRRMGVPWLLAAAGMVLIALAAYERFSLRPELFGYLLLAAQACMLMPHGVSGRSLDREAVVVLVSLQLLLVNLHSYFLLGLVLTGAVLADRVLRLGWARLRGASGGRTEDTAGLRRDAKRLAIVLAAQVVACFANPWTWRLAALPVQTILFMRANDIAGSGLGEGSHPWSVIGEFFRPFAPEAFLGTKATYAYCALLGVAAAGGLACLIRRRWAWLAVLGMMTGVSLSMRRNIAPAAILIVPVALAAIWEAASASAAAMAHRVRRATSLAAAGAIILGSAWLVLAVVTQRFYYNERSPNRFGLGLSRVALPLGAAEWVDEHAPAGRLWCDYNSSSNLHYFTRPHRDVPILTNTWAYPPEVMRQVLDYSEGRRSFGKAAETFGVRVVCLRVDRTSVPLARRLMVDPGWVLAHLDGINAIFLRVDPNQAEPARPRAITAATLDLPGYKARLRSLDPVPAYGLYVGGAAIYHLAAAEPAGASSAPDPEQARRNVLAPLIAWDAAAIDILREVLQLDPTYCEARSTLGSCLARRGFRRLDMRDPNDPNGEDDWQEAEKCFKAALSIRPDYEEARQNLALLEEQMEALKRGILIKWQW